MGVNFYEKIGSCRIHHCFDPIRWIDNTSLITCKIRYLRYDLDLWIFIFSNRLHHLFQTKITGIFLIEDTGYFFYNTHLFSKYEHLSFAFFNYL